MSPSPPALSIGEVRVVAIMLHRNALAFVDAPQSSPIKGGEGPRRRPLRGDRGITGRYLPLTLPFAPKGGGSVKSWPLASASLYRSNHATHSALASSRPSLRPSLRPSSRPSFLSFLTAAGISNITRPPPSTIRATTVEPPADTANTLANTSRGLSLRSPQYNHNCTPTPTR